MGSFVDCRQLEMEFSDAMQPVMRSLSGAEPTPLHSGKLDKNYELQSFGDFIAYNAEKNEQFRFELKVETRHTGNLFIETWSHRAILRLGWMLTVKTDLLLYGFIEPERVVYAIPFGRFRDWLWSLEPTATPSRYRIDAYPLRKQSRHDQNNDTWGHLVPINDIRKAQLIYKELNW